MKRCPNCGSRMLDESYYYKSTFDKYYSRIIKYRCKYCNIILEDGKWTIPKVFTKATKKQKQVVYFINKYLNKNFEPLLMSQCSNIISKYLSDAINAKEEEEENSLGNIIDDWEGYY